MGSVYAGLFGSAGHEVWAIDPWAEHVEAIRQHGLRLEGASGDRVVPIRATTDAAEAGKADLVVIATKAMDVEAAAEGARSLLGAETIVLSIQNGLGGPDAAARVLGDDRVAVGVAGGFGASIVGPGHAHHHGLELIRLGERHGPRTPRIEALAEVWRGAGFTVKTFDDVQRLVWEKLVCNVAFSGPCTILDRTIGEVLDDPSTRGASPRPAVRRRTRSGRRPGVEFGFDDPVAYVRAFGEKIPGARPSMLLDHLAGTADGDRLHQRRDPARRPRGRSRRTRERDGHSARQGARAEIDSARAGDRRRPPRPPRRDRRQPRHPATGHARASTRSRSPTRRLPPERAR